MQKLKGLMTSETNEWYTPKDFYDKLNKEFNFTLDPCCTKESAKCKKFYTIEDDGLSQVWGGEVVFMNPPYGREIKDWINSGEAMDKAGAYAIQGQFSKFIIKLEGSYNSVVGLPVQKLYQIIKEYLD